MRRLLGILAWLLLCVTTIQAQDSGELLVEELTLTQGVDAFGQPVWMAHGFLTNQNEASAYGSISLFADVYDEGGEVIGEGFGYLANACGVALTDYALQPVSSHPFTLTLELYEDDAEPASVDVFPEGSPLTPLTEDTSLPASIQHVSDAEVVALEWVDAISLRYGVGCANNVFTALEWQTFDLNIGASTPITHPNVERVTDALLLQTDLSDPLAYQHSFLTFSPTARRMLYQTDLGVFVTAEPDGSYKRILYDDLFRHSLQGILWQPEGVFLAYYFGAVGEPVLYFTANVDGQRLSRSIYDNLPSLIVPGLTPDGLGVVIALNEEDGTGYYLQDTTQDNRELLFAGDAPGNNYPAPIYASRESGDFIYLVRFIEEQPTLQCFDMQRRELHDLVPLPLSLTSEARAWTWLSPDGFTLALAANGTDSGLWLIDLSAFDVCQ
ncbi:MAG: hypothetical protein U0694_11265 [Anaerolineae bacterium]